MTSSASAVVAVAADRKVADPLRSAIGLALATYLLADLSAIVVDYARTAYVDWDCETCLDPSLVPGAAADEQLWTLSDRLEEPRLTIAVPSYRFVWLCGRRPFSDPAAVRRWSIAVVEPGSYGLFFGVGAMDGSEAARLTRVREMDLKSAVMLKTPDGHLYDGTAPDGTAREIGRTQMLNGVLWYAMTFEVDVEANTLAVQCLWPFSYRALGLKGLTPAQLAEAVVRVHQSGERPVGWKASPVLRTGKLPTADLSRCVPLCAMPSYVRCRPLRIGFRRAVHR
jgi:hypothetical protein